jgi:DNA mismatch repair protein MutS2
MAFAPGDEVHVAALGKGIVREVRNGNRYLVDLKGRAIVTVESQLTAVDQKKRRTKVANPSHAGVTEPPTRSHVAASLDLHGMTVAEAVAALDGFLNDALLAGHAEVRVIHGRSGGRLKAAVHARLKQLAVARSFRVDPANEGVTIVTF